MQKLTLPALGALVLAAAAFGVHLGQTAIEQINPLFFQGPAVHPRDRGAAVAEPSFQPGAPQFAELYGWEEGRAARAADCADCDSLAARDRHSDGEVQFALLETGWQDEPRPVAARPEPAAQSAPEEEPAGFIVEWAEVDRYAGFAVEAKPEPKTAEYASAQE